MLRWNYVKRFLQRSRSPSHPTYFLPPFSSLYPNICSRTSRHHHHTIFNIIIFYSILLQSTPNETTRQLPPPFPLFFFLFNFQRDLHNRLTRKIAIGSAATSAPPIAVDSATTHVATRHPAPTAQHMILRDHPVPMTASPFRPFPNRSDSAAVEQSMKKMGATDPSLSPACVAANAHHPNRFRSCLSTCWRCDQTHHGTICGTWDNISSQSWW